MSRRADTKPRGCAYTTPDVLDTKALELTRRTEPANNPNTRPVANQSPPATLTPAGRLGCAGHELPLSTASQHGRALAAARGVRPSGTALVSGGLGHRVFHCLSRALL
jgi:hypothetical protein